MAQAQAVGIEVLPATAISAVSGGQRVRSCVLVPFDIAQGSGSGAASTREVDLVAMSGGSVQRASEFAPRHQAELPR